MSIKFKKKFIGLAYTINWIKWGGIEICLRIMDEFVKLEYDKSFIIVTKYWRISTRVFFPIIARVNFL